MYDIIKIYGYGHGKEKIMSKKEKVKTPEEIEYQRIRDEKELAKMMREKAKPKHAGYMIYMLIIVTIVYIADEITTQIGTQMQDIMSDIIFAPVFGKEKAVSAMSLLSIFSLLFIILGVFYKPLSDKYGRKIFLVINTLGMGVGMMIIAVCTSIPVYLIGSCVSMFFIPNDMQAMYIYECAPEEKRGRFYSIAKAFATFGMLLIPVLRDSFATYEYVDGVKVMTDINYFMVYFIPAVIAITVAIAAIFLLRESDAFVDSRIHALTMTEEEKAAELAKKQDTQSQGSLSSGIKFIFKHKQILWLMVVNGITMCGVFITQYYTTIINSGYEAFELARGIDPLVAEQYAKATTTQALTLFAIGSGVLQLVQGFIADGLGRKKATIIMSGLSIVAYLLFFFGSRSNWNPYLVGLCAGASVGSYWAMGDILGLMRTESVPTNLRNTVGAIAPLLSMIPFFVLAAVYMVLMGVLGDAAIGTLVLCFSVVGMAIGLVLMAINVKETKGVDLNAIKGDEFEA